MVPSAPGPSPSPCAPPLPPCPCCPCPPLPCAPLPPCGCSPLSSRIQAARGCVDSTARADAVSPARMALISAVPCSLYGSHTRDMSPGHQPAHAPDETAGLRWQTCGCSTRQVDATVRCCQAATVPSGGPHLLSSRSFTAAGSLDSSGAASRASCTAQSGVARVGPVLSSQHPETKIGVGCLRLVISASKEGQPTYLNWALPHA